MKKSLALCKGTKKKILVVHREPIVRHGITQLILKQSDLALCCDCEAEGLPGLVKEIEDKQPDLAIVDFLLEQPMTCFEVLKGLADRFPKLRVLVFSQYDEMVYAHRVLRMGAQGYVMKHESLTTILAAIRRVLHGEIAISGKVANLWVNQRASNSIKAHPGSPLDVLTNREVEVVHLIGNGLNTAQIAETLHLSTKTVASHRDHIKQKLALETHARLIQFAVNWVQSRMTN